MNHRMEVRVPVQRSFGGNLVASFVSASGEQESTAHVENLSAAGLLIRSNQQIQRGETTHCTLIDPRNGLGATFRAEARWTQSNGDLNQNFRIGMAVHEFSDGSREIWDELRLACLETLHAAELIDHTVHIRGAKVLQAEEFRLNSAQFIVDYDASSSESFLISSFTKVDDRSEFVADLVTRIAMLPQVDGTTTLPELWSALAASSSGLVMVLSEGQPLGVSSMKRCGALQLELQRLKARRQERTVELTRAIAAHELRSPLSLVKSSLSLMAEEGFDFGEFKGAGLLEGALQKCEQGLALIERYMGRSSFGFQSNPTDAVSAMREVVQEFAFAALSKAITLQLNIQNNSIWAACGSLDLFQIMRNVISNAIKYSGPASSVEVVLRQLDEVAEIAVRDYGVGIAAADMRQLFSPYGAGVNHPTAGEQQTGIGLFATRQLVEANKGKIIINSKEGDGTTVIIQLPIASSPC